MQIGDTVFSHVGWNLVRQVDNIRSYGFASNLLGNFSAQKDSHGCFSTSTFWQFDVTWRVLERLESPKLIPSQKNIKNSAV